jgi:hypothetical protein
VPDITAPASLIYGPGALRSNRVAPARLRYFPGNVMTERDTPTTTPATIPVLDRLQRFDELMQGEGVHPRFQLIWQRTMQAIEEAFVAINNRVDEVAILARLTAAEQLAQSANDRAVTAEQRVVVVEQAAVQTFTSIDPTFGDQFQNEIQP